MSEVILQIIYWLAVLGIIHSYLLYPIILKLIASNKQYKFSEYNITDQELPKVSILLSIFNEELVIQNKIESVFKTTYPKDKIEFLIGSDNSSDKSNEIVEQLAKNNSGIRFTPYYTRQGKQNVINQLANQATGELFILTDANVFFDKNTLFEIVKYFKETRVGLVDTRMQHVGITDAGISKQESAYIEREVQIKNKESALWGTMMGPFGGCYAIRRSLYRPVPPNFLVDDFYINMKVLEHGSYAINNLEAKVYEDVSNNLWDEFKRKIRIATGNFQNLNAFGYLLFKSIYSKNVLKGLGFTFFSHKVLRWIIPFLILILLGVNLLLIHLDLYLILLAALGFSILVPLFDFLLKKISINISLFRFATHFYSMNLALIIGFFRFVKGVKSGVWKPTKRNQAG